MKIESFDSIGDFARESMRVKKSHAEYLKQGHMYMDFGGNTNLDWHGNVTQDEAFNRAIFGDESNVNKAETMLESIATPTTDAFTWHPSVAGAFPIVPEYLAGRPDNMRYRRHSADESNPIGVYFTLSASVGQTAENLRIRGIAVLALVMRLQAIRPVELTLVATFANPDLILKIRVDTKPLELATAAYAISDPSFYRRFSFHVLLDRLPGHSTMIIKHDTVKDALGITENDILTAPLTAYDPIITDPITWVNSQIARYSTLQD